MSDWVPASETAHSVDTDLGTEKVKSKPAVGATDGFAASSAWIRAVCFSRSSPESDSGSPSRRAATRSDSVENER